MKSKVSKKQEQYLEEEEEFEENNNDEKDQIIFKQQKIIKQMRTQFADTIDSFRSQLSDLIQESSSIQEGMLQRIAELKSELNDLRNITHEKIENKKAIKNNQTEIRSSLYSNIPKHPRKLAPSDDNIRSSYSKLKK